MPKLYTVDELSASIEVTSDCIRKTIRKLGIKEKGKKGIAKLYTYTDLKHLYKNITGTIKPKKVTIDLGKPEDYIPLCFQNMETDEELIKHIEATERRIAKRRAQLGIIVSY